MPTLNAVKNFLNSFKVSYVEYDVSKDPQKLQEMYLKSGQYGTPVIDVDDTIMKGFDPAQLIQLLRQRVIYHN